MNSLFFIVIPLVSIDKILAQQNGFEKQIGERHPGRSEAAKVPSVISTPVMFVSPNAVAPSSTLTFLFWQEHLTRFMINSSSPSRDFFFLWCQSTIFTVLLFYLPFFFWGSFALFYQYSWFLILEELQTHYSNIFLQLLPSQYHHI